MDIQEALEKLKKLQTLVKHVQEAGKCYEAVAKALNDPLGTRIEGYKAPVGFGERVSLTERPQSFDELKDKLFQIQWLFNELRVNADSLKDENVKQMLASQLGRIDPRSPYG